MRHGLGFGISNLATQLFLPELNLLLLLNEGTATAAARCQEIGDEVALEVVLVTDIGALHEHGDPVETDTHRSPEAQALVARQLVLSKAVGKELTVGLTAL